MKEDREAALPISPHDALRWHIEMGVDELIDDQPIDRYAAAAIPRAAVAVPSPSANSQPTRPPMHIRTAARAFGRRTRCDRHCTRCEQHRRPQGAA